MVALLALAHERACEVELAECLTVDLADGRLPNLAALQARFAPDPARLPEVTVDVVPLALYDALLAGEVA
jgi:hypothetical protein